MHINIRSLVTSSQSHWHSYILLFLFAAGYGDMAISNSIGSNIFDILLCLGLPWFLQTTLVHLGTHSFGSEVNIYNTGSLYIALMLFGTVFMLLFLLKLARFQLGKLLGGIFLIVYSVTIAVGVFIDAYLFSSKLPGCNFWLLYCLIEIPLSSPWIHSQSSSYILLHFCQRQASKDAVKSPYYMLGWTCTCTYVCTTPLMYTKMSVYDDCMWPP